MLFGRKRKHQIHDQAVLLMQEWNGMLNASGALTFGKSEDELDNMSEDQATILMHKYSMALLGILSYMVAGLNHFDTAQEMVELYKRMFASYSNEMNPEGITANEAVDRVNSYYQNARNVSDTLMGQGKGLPVITRALAEDIFKWINTGATEDDISTIENFLNVFYQDTYEKYYGE